LSEASKFYAKSIGLVKKNIQALEKNKIKNFFSLRRTRKELQALQEGQLDVLNTSITGVTTGPKVVDKNNYPTYASQIQASYDMYMSKSEYGSEIYRGAVETRVALIGGEGLSIFSKKESTQEYIDKFLDLNKLHGSKLLTMITNGELEGKNLVLLKRRQKKSLLKEIDYIQVLSFPYYYYPYSIDSATAETDDIKKITYREKKDGSIGEEKTINKNEAVFVKLGGTEIDIIETTNRLHCILTDFENYSRAKYDLRKNGFLFGRYMPTWKFDKDDPAATRESKSIRNTLEGDNWSIGMGYAGTSEFALKGPDGEGVNVLIKDMLASVRNIAATAGIPIHWLSFPDLMSNRATAENLLEAVNLATKKERLIWEEAFREIIKKGMIMAIDAGYETNDIIGEFSVKLPLISLANLKALIEVWEPLWGSDVISLSTFRNMLPGINPSDEAKLIEKETEEAAKNSPLNNNTLNQTIGDLQDGEISTNANTGSD